MGEARWGTFGDGLGFEIFGLNWIGGWDRRVVKWFDIRRGDIRLAYSSELLVPFQQNSSSATADSGIICTEWDIQATNYAGVEPKRPRATSI